MKTLLVGFGHRMRRGKDTAAQTIIQTRGIAPGEAIDTENKKYDVRRYAFADALKREANDAAEKAGGMDQLISTLKAAGTLPEWVQYDPAPDMTDPLCSHGKQRTLLQWWGTEYRRARDPFYWVKKLRKTLLVEQPQIALITDMRFLNEFNWIKAEEGETVRIERIGFEGGNAHSSETELDSARYDYTIIAEDGDVEEVRKCAVAAFDMIVASLNPPDIKIEELYAELVQKEQSVSA